MQFCHLEQEAQFRYYLGLCQLKLEDDTAALQSFVVALENGFANKPALHMQLARTHARLRQDELAYDELIRARQHGARLYPWFRSPSLKSLKSRHEKVSFLYHDTKASFDSWTIIFVPFILLGLLQAAIFKIWRKKFIRHTKYLSGLLVVFSVMMISYVLYWTNFVFDFPYLTNWWHALYYLIGPLYYLYVKGVFSEGDENKTSTFLHFIPFLLCVAFILPMLTQSYGLSLNWPAWMLFSGAHYLPKMLHLIAYLIATIWIAKNDMQVDDHIRSWTRVVIISFALFLAANITYFFLVQWSGFNAEWDYMISIVMCMSVLTTGVFGLIQPRVFKSTPISTALSPIKYKSSGLTAAASQSLNRELIDLMAEQEVYRENELRLNDLASYLQTSKHNVSQVINEHYNVSFFEFVNSYRVEYVAACLSSPKYSQDTIIQLAYDAGFNNKVSFNKAFKATYNMTPSAFRKLKRNDWKIRQQGLNN